MKLRRPTRSALTKERIIDTAERIVADVGVEGASMRAITGAAEVNLAAVNYHFGSKEALLTAVFNRRLRPVNVERVRRLDAAERAAGTGSPSLHDIIAAYVEPALLPEGDRHTRSRVRALLARLIHEPGGFAQQLFATEMEGLLHRFTAALTRALPQVPRDELFWRLHLCGGALALALHQAEPAEPPDDGTPPPPVHDLIGFLAAGFRAAAGEPTVKQAVLSA